MSAELDEKASGEETTMESKGVLRERGSRRILLCRLRSSSWSRNLVGRLSERILPASRRRVPHALATACAKPQGATRTVATLLRSSSNRKSLHSPLHQQSMTECAAKDEPLLNRCWMHNTYMLDVVALQSLTTGHKQFSESLPLSYSYLSTIACRSSNTMEPQESMS
jgi:hypothetical protein